MSKLDFNTILAISIHDTKNALSMLVTSLDGLLDPESGGCRCDPKEIARLQYEARRANDNLVQLLTLYRTDQGLYEPRFGICLIYEILEDYYLLNKPLMDHNGVICEIDCEKDLCWTLDRQLITAILENVIINTVRYTRGRLRMSAGIADGCLMLEVEDDGPGFPERMLGRREIDDASPFDPASGRTGLGLYFCALIARMHAAGDRQGYIELANDGQLGGGRFRLVLPPLS